MSHAGAAGTLLGQQGEELARLAGQVGGSERVVFKYVRTLVAHMIRADGGSGSEELILQAVLNGEVTYSWVDEDEYARIEVRDNPGFLRSVPSFLVAATQWDERYGTQIGRQMVQCIDAMCDTIGSVDGQRHPDELENRAVLLATLNTAVNRHMGP